VAGAEGVLDRPGKGQFECEGDVGLSTMSRLFRERDECAVTRAQNIAG